MIQSSLGFPKKTAERPISYRSENQFSPFFNIFHIFFLLSNFVFSHMFPTCSPVFTSFFTTFSPVFTIFPGIFTLFLNCSPFSTRFSPRFAPGFSARFPPSPGFRQVQQRLDLGRAPRLLGHRGRRSLRQRREGGRCRAWDFPSDFRVTLMGDLMVIFMGDLMVIYHDGDFDGDSQQNE